MQLPRPISIDMLDFLRDGRFDCIEPGQTKEWILNNFPDPDGKCRIADDIWLYGNIEFHFGGGELVHIYSDHFPHEKLHGGRHIALKRRLLSRVKKLNLPHVIRWLNRRGIDFVKQSDKLGIRLYLQSGVELYFENDSGRPDRPRRFKMTAFCRTNGGANRYPVIRRLTGGE